MRRCQSGGLIVDDEGLTVPPEVVEERIRTLSFFTGHFETDIEFIPTVVANLDVEGYEQDRIRRDVFLARYLRQPIGSLDKMTVPEIRALVKATIEVLKQENGISAKQEDR